LDIQATPASTILHQTEGESGQMVAIPCTTGQVQIGTELIINVATEILTDGRG